VRSAADDAEDVSKSGRESKWSQDGHLSDFTPRRTLKLWLTRQISMQKVKMFGSMCRRSVEVEKAVASEAHAVRKPFCLRLQRI